MHKYLALSSSKLLHFKILHCHQNPHSSLHMLLLCPTHKVSPYPTSPQQSILYSAGVGKVFCKEANGTLGFMCCMLSLSHIFLLFFACFILNNPLKCKSHSQFTDHTNLGFGPNLNHRLWLPGSHYVMIPDMSF